MLIIIIVCLIVIAFAAVVYIQDGTDFTKQTKYSFFDILLKNEVRTLNTIYKALQKAQGEYRILVNVHVQDGATVHKIPAVLVHESGIHIVSTIKKDGWVIGSDRMLNWTNVLYGNKQQTFENPILTNKRSIYALRDSVMDLPDKLFHSVIAFNDGCSFQKIEINADDVEVLKHKDLSNWAKSLASESLSADDIKSIYESLKDKMVFDKEVVAKQLKGKSKVA